MAEVAKGKDVAEPEPIPLQKRQSSPPTKGKVSGYSVSIIGTDVHIVEGKKLRNGRHYDFASLGIDMTALARDPKVVVEPVDEDGKVISKRDLFDDEDDN